ncbi:hypothetical protein Ccrd_020809 [Cynara cardunculus var. scolymus]|uniref:Uncharacterized protein n=1 Tax=Cynara cardunculus var. scolymus TaxID=59895 RepID=A0A103Y1S2_CYNCS|nr:hypothetical protein Ccrd_020809 [Cynara cardunculus var. scolymus]
MEVYWDPSSNRRLQHHKKDFALLVETRPAISVWNKDYLCRREYLELNDGGFGAWPFIRHEGMHEDRSWPDVFAERSVNPKVSSKSKLQRKSGYNGIETLDAWKLNPASE